MRRPSPARSTSAPRAAGRPGQASVTDPIDPRRARLYALAATARTGQQRETMPALLELANGDDALSAWIAADALAQIMWWIDFPGAAGDMVERVVLRFGPLAESAELPWVVSFDIAVAAGARYDGTEGRPRLLRMAEALPAGHSLRDRCLFAAEHLDDPRRPAGLPLCLTEPRPLQAAYRPLAAKPPQDLSPGERDRLWTGYADASQREGLIGLYDAGCPVQARCPVEWRLAEALYGAGRPADAEAVLLAAREHWLVFTPWDTMPMTPILSPGLRPAVTQRVKEEYLTRPLEVSADPPPASPPSSSLRRAARRLLGR